MGEDYILTFKGEGDDVQQLIEEKMKENFPGEEIAEELLNGLPVNDLQYRFVINQDTYYPQSIQIDMDFNIEQNENRTHVTQSLHSEYCQFNGVGVIDITAEVKEEAKEMDNMPGFIN